ncbi:MAG: hypothetical protein Tsb009_30810 [Planctomycetaceae bacterium]
MSRKQIIQKIVKRESEQQSLLAENVLQDDRALYESACDAYGTWETALDYAGIDFAALVVHEARLTPARLIELIQQRHEMGLSLAWNRVYQENRLLATVARNAFQSWKNALQAAGLAPPPRRRWSCEKVIEALQERHRQGLPMRSISKKEGALYTAAIRYFGNYPSALKAAGILEGE